MKKNVVKLNAKQLRALVLSEAGKNWKSPWGEAVPVEQDPNAHVISTHDAPSKELTAVVNLQNVDFNVRQSDVESVLIVDLADAWENVKELFVDGNEQFVNVIDQFIAAALASAEKRKI